MLTLPIEALRLRSEAVLHKQAARRHRRLAREKMEAFAAFCKAHGIELVDNLPTGEQGENFDGHREYEQQSPARSIDRD